MKFKHSWMRLQWLRMDWRIKLVLRMTDNYSQLIAGKPITITSLYRNDKTKHKKWVAGDIRTKGPSEEPYYTDEQRKRIVNFLYVFRNNSYGLLAVQPHAELVGTPQEHIHIHIKGA